MKALTVKQAAVMALMANGYTAQETGGKLGITAASVRTAIHRARKRIGCGTNNELFFRYGVSRPRWKPPTKEV